MTTILKHRRGTTAQHASFTGAVGEITVDTDKDTAVVHDGTTVGGFPLLAKTMNDGTANGVAYLNGSKVLTTGSALTFDGTVLNASTGTPVIRATASTVNALYGLEFNGGALDAFVKAQPNSSELRIASGRSAGWGGFTSFYIDTAEKMRLTSTGLGIGTSSPAFKLSVQGNAIIAGSSPYLAFGASASVGATPTYIERNGTTGLQTFYNNGTGINGAMAFVIGAGSEGMRLDSSGNLGIGTSSPGAKLDVVGTSGTEQFRIGNTTGGTDFGITVTENGTAVINSAEGATGRGIQFQSGGTNTLLIDSSGNLGLGVTPSAWGSGYKAIEFGGGGSSLFSGTSVAAQTYLTANAYFNGTSWIYKNTAAAAYYEQLGSSHRWYTAPSGTAGNAISFTQAMTLDASGNLGIGTSSPASYNAGGNSLVVGGSGNYKGMTIASAIEGNIYFADGTSGTETYRGIVGYNHTSDFMAFYTAANERARIDSSGNLLVGTTGQTLGTARLCVSSAGLTTVSTTSTGTESSYAAFNTATSGNNQFMWFYTGDSGQTFRGSIEFNRGSGVVAYNTTSDYRAKDIIGPVTDSGSLIDSVPVYIGKMKGATQERPMFIAHETPAYAHTGEKDAVDADGNPVYQQMDASALIPVMWAEIQSLRQRLAAAGI